MDLGALSLGDLDAFISADSEEHEVKRALSRSIFAFLRRVSFVGDSATAAHQRVEALTLLQTGTDGSKDDKVEVQMPVRLVSGRAELAHKARGLLGHGTNLYPAGLISGRTRRQLFKQRMSDEQEGVGRSDDGSIIRRGSTISIAPAPAPALSVQPTTPHSPRSPHSPHHSPTSTIHSGIHSTQPQSPLSLQSPVSMSTSVRSAAQAPGQQAQGQQAQGQWVQAQG